MQPLVKSPPDRILLVVCVKKRSTLEIARPLGRISCIGKGIRKVQGFVGAGLSLCMEMNRSIVSDCKTEARITWLRS